MRRMQSGFTESPHSEDADSSFTRDIIGYSMFSGKGYRPRTQEKLDSCGWPKIQKISAGRESGEVGIFLLVGCEIGYQRSISVWYSNYWSKLQELPDTGLRNRPLCSYRKIRLRALALLLQTSGARFNRRTAHIPNSSKEAT